MNDHVETLDIEALVARARRGDHAAFTALYDAFAGRLYRFIRFRVGDDRDAEDLVQRVFLKVIEALPRYEQRGTPFAAWLFRLTRNVVIDHVRTRRPAEPLEALTARPATDRGPEELALSAIELDAIEAALDVLTPEQREVIAYRFFGGLSPAEIGLVMGKREGSVRALQFRALAALRRELADG
jgi:RNA polymerase sigma-70 factor (ECF subfamily)